MRAADLVVVRGYTHHSALGRALQQQLIKASADDIAIPARFHFLHHIGNGVIEFERIRNRYKGTTAAGFHRRRLVIVK